MSEPLTSKYTGDSAQSLLDPALSARRSSGSSIYTSEVNAGAMSAFFFQFLVSSWLLVLVELMGCLLVVHAEVYVVVQRSPLLILSLTWIRTPICSLLLYSARTPVRRFATASHAGFSSSNCRVRDLTKMRPAGTHDLFSGPNPSHLTRYCHPRHLRAVCNRGLTVYASRRSIMRGAGGTTGTDAHCHWLIVIGWVPSG